jgi:uncharacterized membrane protein YebE (DUF533 family)
VRNIGWHLDDVPQPYLTYRRVAFSVIVLLFAAAVADGLLLGYDATQGRSLTTPFAAYGVMAVIGMIAGGVFGWTNKKSPRWREWREAPQTLTPRWPSKGNAS